MRILGIFAVEAEFAPWRKLRHFETVELGSVTLHRTEIGPATVDFIVTGMGPENARRVSNVAMAAKHDFCIASGFAGALQSNYRVGDVLVARAVQQHGNSATIECSRRLYESGIEHGAVPVNMLLTTDKLVSTADEKKQLGLFADVVDMESFAVLSSAQEHDLPAIAIRVITDQVDEDMPADIEKTVDPKGRVRLGAVASYVSRHPLQLPAMIRLGRKSRMAAEALAQYLETYIKKLSSETHSATPAKLVEIAAT